MAKNALAVLWRIAVASILSCVILNLLNFFYYSIPEMYINQDGSTNYKNKANAFFFSGIEGFGWGKTNNDGFSNMFDYEDNMNIDVLVMGSSFMEARQVGMNQSTASILNTLLENEKVYNIGYSGHDFLTCTGNLKAALKKYQPTQYVIIVTSSVSYLNYSDEQITQIISDKKPEVVIKRKATGVIAKTFDLLKKSSYFRLIALQKNTYFKNVNPEDIEEAEDIQSITNSDTANSEKLLNDLLHKISTLTEEYGAKVIIAYHPSMSIAFDGTMNLNVDQNTVTQFKRTCDANGILFLDMCNRFIEEYENTYILPYGFSNTAVGRGHFNKYGHEMMASELYRMILEDKK